MIWESEGLLAAYRKKWCCENCLRGGGGLHPHHIHCRGMGGGGRLDHPFNLVALCPPCHEDAHNGKIKRSVFIMIVAQREKLDPKDVEAELIRLRRCS